MNLYGKYIIDIPVSSGFELNIKQQLLNEQTTTSQCHHYSITILLHCCHELQKGKAATTTRYETDTGLLSKIVRTPDQIVSPEECFV